MPPLAPLRQRKLPIPPPETAAPATSSREECAQLHAYLRTHGYVGSTHGITRKALRAQFSASVGRFVSDRRLQRIVSDAPSLGFPVASNSRTGYFVVETAEEFDACIEELESRAREHTWRAASLRSLRPALVTPESPRPFCRDCADSPDGYCINEPGELCSEVTSVD